MASPKLKILCTDVDGKLTGFFGFINNNEEGPKETIEKSLSDASKLENPISAIECHDEIVDCHDEIVDENFERNEIIGESSTSDPSDANMKSENEKTDVQQQPSANEPSIIGSVRKRKSSPFKNNLQQIKRVF